MNSCGVMMEDEKGDKTNETIVEARRRHKTEYMKTWRLAHPGYDTAIERKYRLAHPESSKEAQRKWRISHPLREDMIRWRLLHKTTITKQEFRCAQP